MDVDVVSSVLLSLSGIALAVALLIADSGRRRQSRVDRARAAGELHRLRREVWRQQA